jgi:hypothetical protein
MILVGLRIVAAGSGLAAALLLGSGPSWAGIVPAPMVGVTGPFGIVAAAVALGGYLLVKRFRNRG